LRRHLEEFPWTTDGLYRETRDKVASRVAEGCLTVEMEAAAFFAVAAFRGIADGDDDQPLSEVPTDFERKEWQW